MMTQDRDYEDALRRALTAAAESIEPAGDGLQRIRHRLDSPRSPRSVLSGCTEWLELRGTRFLIRLEPLTEAGRTALRRSGPLASFLRGLFSPRAARRAGGHRGAAGSPGRLGPAGPWLKPVFAVSAAVAIVVVGVVILNHETGTLISPSYSVTRPTSQGSALTHGGTTANSKRWKLPLGVNPTQQVTGRAQNKNVTSGLPAVACTPTPAPSPTATAPTGSATATPTPSPSGIATSTPTTPQPTGSDVPSPTPSASTGTAGAAPGGADAGGTATRSTVTTATRTVATAVLSVDAGGPIVECGAGSKH
jgi:hypothetical protein